MDLRAQGIDDQSGRLHHRAVPANGLEAAPVLTRPSTTKATLTASHPATNRTNTSANASNFVGNVRCDPNTRFTASTRDLSPSGGGSMVTLFPIDHRPVTGV